jgi:hypothetical protein
MKFLKKLFSFKGETESEQASQEISSNPCDVCEKQSFICLCPKKIAWDNEHLPPLKPNEVRYFI